MIHLSPAEGETPTLTCPRPPCAPHSSVLTLSARTGRDAVQHPGPRSPVPRHPLTPTPPLLVARVHVRSGHRFRWSLRRSTHTPYERHALAPVSRHRAQNEHRQREQEQPPGHVFANTSCPRTNAAAPTPARAFAPRIRSIANADRRSRSRNKPARASARPPGARSRAARAHAITTPSPSRHGPPKRESARRTGHRYTGTGTHRPIAPTPPSPTRSGASTVIACP